jgi:hypothetical protein
VEEQSQRIVFFYSQFNAGPGGQDFQIEVSGDGSVFYEGRARVKTLGVVRFNVPRENVQALARELDQSGVLRQNPRLGTTAHTLRMTTATALYAKGRSHALVYSLGANPELDRIRVVLEAYVPTLELRCPYVFPSDSVFSGLDICAAQEPRADTRKGN